MTPFQRHKAAAERQLAITAQRAQLAARQPRTADMSVTDHGAFEILTASLAQDLQALSGLVQGPDKDAKRRECVSRYQGHVEAYLSSGEVYANPVLVQAMIWQFDLDHLTEALRLGRVCVEQDQRMPSHFNRNLPTFVADSVLAWAEREIKLGHSPQPYLSQLNTEIQTWPVPDVVRMKYAKCLGNQAFEAQDWTAAVQCYEQAITLETDQHKAKVSTRLDKARAELAKVTPEPAHEPEPKAETGSDTETDSEPA